MRGASGVMPRDLFFSSAVTPNHSRPSQGEASGSLPTQKACVAYPGRSSRREAELAQVLKQTLRPLVRLTERAPRQSQRVAKEFLRLPALAALQERKRQVARRYIYIYI